MEIKPTATLVYVVDPNLREVLLIKKVRKVAIGHWLGFGGKIDEGYTSLSCAREETSDETCGHIEVREEELILVGRIDFYNGEDYIPHQCNPWFTVDIYIVLKNKSAIGIPPTKKSEVIDPTWFKFTDLPKLKQGDDLFLLPILSGQCVTGRICFVDEHAEVYKDSYIVQCTRESLAIV